MLLEKDKLLSKQKDFALNPLDRVKSLTIARRYFSVIRK